MSRPPFPSGGAKRAATKLELVHTDICGPMSLQSPNGSRYVLTFVDDLTRMCWAYFLRDRTSVLQVFKEFKLMVEKQSGCFLKILRSDNAKEFTSVEFNSFCSNNGLVHQLSAPYTPQQNGVAERKNHSLLEMARCMMIEKGVPRCFWAEAVNTSIYLQNRLPTRAVKDKTPFEAWFGYKPSARHFKVFGSVCFVQVPDAKRKKLENKAVAGVFMGYSTFSKAYRIYDPEQKKILVSRDVIVDENSSWTWNEESGADSKNQTFNVPLLSFPLSDSQVNQEVADANDYVNNGEDEQEVIPSLSSSTNLSPSSSGGISPVLRTRSINELYADTIQEQPGDFDAAVFDDANERCFHVTSVEPANFEEAVEDAKWRDAMQAEMSSIVKNQTWSLVDLPSNKQAIGLKWIFRTKLNVDGSVNKHKARLVVKGYAQEPGVDFGDTFSLVARLDTIKILLALAAQNRWEVHHMDVKSAFLNGILEEDIYVQQPTGFEVPGEEDKVYKLHKALYGLKQAPRAWYSRID